jgi:hypothetical protein
MSEDTIKIENWLRSREIEDQITSKSKSRVLRTMAEGIKQTKQLPKGRCSICGNYSEELIPQVLNVCKLDLDKMHKNNESIRIIKSEFVTHYCDICLGRSMHKFNVNIYICPNCMKKIGNKHKNNLFEMRKEKEQFKRKRGW